jgi:glycyl-tRNA synthetase
MDLKDTGAAVIDIPGVGNGKVEFTPDLILIEKRTRVEHMRTFIPNVVEPSFGVGRILYALCEHVYWTRKGDENRSVLSFPPSIAPMAVALYPLTSNASFTPLITHLSTLLRRRRINHSIDDSSVSIGRRYRYVFLAIESARSGNIET